MRRTLPLAALLSLALARAAWAGNGGFAPVEPASPGAEETNDVYWLLVGVGLFIAIVVFVPLTVFIVRFGHRGRPRAVEGPQIRGNTQLEIGWTIGAVLIVVAIVAFTLYKIPGIVDPAAAGEGEGVEVRVEGRQFYWLYEYEGGITSIDRLRLPVGEAATLRITAPAGDVVHSFWVPALGGKRDAVPGQETTLELVPQREGVFDGVCAEFCGVQHAAMRLEVEVMSRQAYDAWLAGQRRESDLGGQIWAGVCQKCHDQALDLAPQIVGNPTLADREALTRIVTQGRGRMPAVGQDWSEQQLNALLDFAGRLGGGGGG